MNPYPKNDGVDTRRRKYSWLSKILLILLILSLSGNIINSQITNFPQIASYVSETPMAQDNKILYRITGTLTEDYLSQTVYIEVTSIVIRWNFETIGSVFFSINSSYVYIMDRVSGNIHIDSINEYFILYFGSYDGNDIVYNIIILTG